MYKSEEGRLRISSSRWPLFGSGFLVCVSCGALRVSVPVVDQKAMPPAPLQQQAAQMTRDLFPAAPGDTARVTLKWCGLAEPPAGAHHPCVWAADVWQNEQNRGRFLFDQTGLRQYSGLFTSQRVPLTTERAAQHAAQAFLRCLQQPDGVNQSFVMLRDGRIWRCCIRQKNCRIRLTLDAQTGNLLFFTQSRERLHNAVFGTNESAY